jgi:sugar O-acyltransferase (sialic acid O-acetyltransferase NeuD family)
MYAPNEELMDRALYIFGAGAHAEVVAELAEILDYSVKAFIVSSPPESFFPQPWVLEDELDWSRISLAVVAIGDNSTRERVVGRIKERAPHVSLPSLIDPSARISPSSTVNEGTLIMAAAVIQTSTCIGPFTIINTGAIIEHHCKVGRFAHIAPGATLGGEVSVGEGAFVGLGAVVLPRLTVGNRAILGAGAVALADIVDDMTLVGVPARPLTR